MYIYICIYLYKYTFIKIIIIILLGDMRGIRKEGDNYDDVSTDNMNYEYDDHNNNNNNNNNSNKTSRNGYNNDDNDNTINDTKSYTSDPAYPQHVLRPVWGANRGPQQESNTDMWAFDCVDKNEIAELRELKRARIDNGIYIYINIYIYI
jgi:hypothetical protein